MVRRSRPPPRPGGCWLPLSSRDVARKRSAVSVGTGMQRKAVMAFSSAVTVPLPPRPRAPVLAIETRGLVGGRSHAGRGVHRACEVRLVGEAGCGNRLPVAHNLCRAREGPARPAIGAVGDRREVSLLSSRNISLAADGGADRPRHRQHVASVPARLRVRQANGAGKPANAGQGGDGLDPTPLWLAA